MDFFTPKNNPLFNAASKTQVLAGLFAIILLSLVGLGLFLEDEMVLIPYVGLTTVSFGVIYFVSLKTIYEYQRQQVSIPQLEHAHPEQLTIKTIVLRYSLYALIIVQAALSLPYFAEQLAHASGLGQSFVGTLFLAISTSLPEIAVSLAAVRMGSIDLAIGNLMGSNLLNVFILFLDDLLYTKGHLLKDASDSNLISVFFVVLMSAVACVGFVFPSQQKRSLVSITSFLILILWLINMGLFMAAPPY